MPDVSVLDFGADQTGSNDSTQAFLDARQAADGGTVRIPKGDYRIQPDHPTLFWWAARWVGDSHENDQNDCTKILPTGPGAVLVKLPGKGYIESIVIDCEDQVETGLHVERGHRSYLRDIRIRNATDYGAKFLESTLNTYGIRAEFCAKGLLLRGCNGSNFVSLSAQLCNGVGLEVQGGASGLTRQSGVMSISAAGIEKCGQDGTSPLVWFRGVEGGVYELQYLEGEADGIRLDDNTYNCTFIGTRHAINSTHNVLLRLQHARTVYIYRVLSIGRKYRNQ